MTPPQYPCHPQDTADATVQQRGFDSPNLLLSPPVVLPMQSKVVACEEGQPARRITGVALLPVHGSGVVRRQVGQVGAIVKQPERGQQRCYCHVDNQVVVWNT
jgi:hypothetical protein